MVGINTLLLRSVKREELVFGARGGRVPGLRKSKESQDKAVF